MTNPYKKIPLDQLQRGRYQPRQDFDATALQELANSIVAQGLIEPLIVRPITKNHYEIIAGERRWRAAQLARLTEVPCLIGDYTDQQAAAVTVIENIQRQNLNLIEEAVAYNRLLTEFHFTQEDVASLVGKSRSHIANLLRLLTLHDSVQTLIRQQQLSLGHARQLVGLDDTHQRALSQRVLNDSWSVRRLEDEVRRIKNGVSSALNQPIDADINCLQTKLAEQLSTPVKIEKDTQHGGWIKIKYFDNDTLEGLLKQLGIPSLEE